MDELNTAYYAVIPASVRYDDSIPANAKLLYGEITALCSKEGFCWATNDYFSKLYGFTKQSISRLISKLEEAGHIRIDTQYNENNSIKRRCISIADPITQNVNPYQKSLPSLTEKVIGVNQKDNTPYQKSLYPLTEKVIPLNRKVKENNTNNNTLNTTSNNINKYINNNIYNISEYEDILCKIEDEDLKLLYVEYINMRQRIKSPMTGRALTILINKVNEIGKDLSSKKKIIEAAILNNWKSVYPLKEDDKIVCNENNKYAGVMDSIRAKRRRNNDLGGS